ncbi:MAG TPA: glycosyltransferase family 39 protein, partial [Polyangiaceae bacterium]|nr:glycosyltransferase family 39 protein [Polyangiaceae bacterium]
MSSAAVSGALSARSPRATADDWIGRVAWGVIALSALQILLFGFGRDQGIYAVVGDAMLDGRMPYRDAWDFKPPGIFLVYALAEALFGKAMSSIRLLEVGGLLAMAVAFRKLGKTLFDSSTAGLVGAALAVLIHAELEFWHTAQPESFGGMLTVFALVVVTGDAVSGTTPGQRLRAATLVGALFGAAFLFKPPLGGGALVCAAYMARAEWLRSSRASKAMLPVLVAGAGSLLPIALVVGWFWVRGALPALGWTLFEFTPGYTTLGWHGAPQKLFSYAFVELLTGFSYVLPLGLGLSLVLPRVSDREREVSLLVTGIVCMHVAGIALQAKFFQYHYGATLPLVSLVSGLGLYKAWRWTQRRTMLGAVAFALLIVVLGAERVALRHNPGTFWERSADRLAFLVTRAPSREDLDAKLYRVADYDLGLDRRAARDVARLTKPGDSIFVWGFEPAIYWLARRRAASRFVYDVP